MVFGSQIERLHCTQSLVVDPYPFIIPILSYVSKEGILRRFQRIGEEVVKVSTV